MTFFLVVTIQITWIH